MVWRENMDSGYPNFQLDTRSGGSRRNLAYLLIRTLMGRIADWSVGQTAYLRFHH
jgi:hypothetical protein